MNDPEDFEVGEWVGYDIHTQRGADWRISARVVGHTKTRVVVEFHHWETGDSVQRAARPHRLTKRAQDAG